MVFVMDEARIPKCSILNLTAGDSCYFRRSKFRAIDVDPATVLQDKATIDHYIIWCQDEFLASSYSFLRPKNLSPTANNEMPFERITDREVEVYDAMKYGRSPSSFLILEAPKVYIGSSTIRKRYTLRVFYNDQMFWLLDLPDEVLPYYFSEVREQNG